MSSIDYCVGAARALVLSGTGAALGAELPVASPGTAPLAAGVSTELLVLPVAAAGASLVAAELLALSPCFFFLPFFLPLLSSDGVAAWAEASGVVAAGSAGAGAGAAAGEDAVGSLGAAGSAVGPTACAKAGTAVRLTAAIEAIMNFRMCILPSKTVRTT